MEQLLQSAGQTQNVPIKKPFYKRWWVIAIGVFIVIGIIGNSNDKKNSNTDDTTSQAAQDQPKDTQSTPTEPMKQEEPKQTEAAPQPMAPEVTATSANISKEYSDNEVSADAKYKGKLIEVSGKVSTISNGTFDNEMVVKLSDGQYDINGPMCYMKENEREKVLAFKKGQSVTLIGTGDSATLGSPALKDCVVK